MNLSFKYIQHFNLLHLLKAYVKTRFCLVPPKEEWQFWKNYYDMLCLSKAVSFRKDWHRGRGVCWVGISWKWWCVLPLIRVNRIKISRIQQEFFLEVSKCQFNHKLFCFDTSVKTLYLMNLIKLQGIHSETKN